MGFYNRRLLKIIIVILFGVITSLLKPIIGFYYASFAALCGISLAFVILPTLRGMFIEKQECKTINKDDIAVIILTAIGILVVGLAMWDKTH